MRAYLEKGVQMKTRPAEDGHDVTQGFPVLQIHPVKFGV